MNKKDNFLQFVKFGFVGFINTVISYVVYAVLTFIGVPYLIASVLGFIAGVLNSYALNSRYVFKVKTDEHRNEPIVVVKTFITYAVTGLIIANILLVLFVEKLGIGKYIAKLLTLAITVPMNFLISKFWTYKGKKNS